MAGKGRPDAIDKHVGARLRMRRVEVGLSQPHLAERLGGSRENGKGIAFQQVQKYESGANRISASRLYQAATVLRVPVSYFFEGLPDPSRAAGGKGAANGHDYTTAFLGSEYGSVVARALPKMKPSARKAVLSLIASLTE